MFNRTTVARELHDYNGNVYTGDVFQYHRRIISSYATNGLNAMATADRDTIVQLFEEASVFPERQVVR